MWGDDCYAPEVDFLKKTIGTPGYPGVPIELLNSSFQNLDNPILEGYYLDTLCRTVQSFFVPLPPHRACYRPTAKVQSEDLFKSTRVDRSILLGRRIWNTQRSVNHV